MKSLALCSALCLSLVSASAQQAPTPQQLLDAAHKATDLASAGAYTLQATLVVNPKNPKSERRGTLMIVRDHDRARFTLEADGRTEERVVLGSKQFVIPGQGTLPAMGLKEFDYNWDPGRPPRFATHEKPSFGKVRRQKIQGRDAWCFDRKVPQWKTKLCFDAATSLLLHEGSSEKSRTEYSDYASFGTSMYPQKVQIFRENLAPFELDQIAIATAQSNDDVFKVPEKVIEVEDCDYKEPPKPIHTPEPEFPKDGRDAKEQGLVVLYVLVNTEGKVAELQALNTDSSYGFAQNALDMVKTWRFKPATCNGRPVAMEMNIEVDFRLF
jgi:TonB family protein